MKDILFSLWFFLPAGLANAAPVFANKIPYLNRWHTPLDLNMEWNRKRLLGPNKTWRGLCFGVIVGILVCALQKIMFLQHETIRSFSSAVDYSAINPVLLGGFLAAGALFGDAVESLLKRQSGVKPGDSWFPFDQLDYIAGGLLFSTVIVRLAFKDYLLTIGVWFGLHLIASYIGWRLHLKDKPI